MQRIKQTALEVVGAILPVAVVVFILQVTLVKLPVQTLIQFLVGAILVGVGLILFLLGVQQGLLPMGEHIGEALSQSGKLWVMVFFGFVLGLAATIAEPNVRILAAQVDMVSTGLIPNDLLIGFIALGVAISVALAMLRMVLGIPLILLLMGGYGLALALAMMAPPQYLPISFDAGGMTTGPLIIPFILSLGVGVASVLGSKTTSGEGFGMVGLAYVGPVLAVLLLGVIYG